MHRPSTADQRVHGGHHTVLDVGHEGQRRTAGRGGTRAAAAGLSALVVGAGIAASLAWRQDAEQAPAAAFTADRPRTGVAAAGLDSLDHAVEEILESHGIPGASMTIALNGQVMLARGYGFARLETGEPMRPDTHFLLASVSKAITAVTVLRLAERGDLGLDDAVYSLIEPIEPAPGRNARPEVLAITVRQCLHHEGGWDRRTSGDPAGWGRRVMRALGLSDLPTMFDLARYMLAQPLDFAPGTQAVYSNVGYDLCGAAITRRTRRSYGETVEELVLHPMGLTAMRADPRAPRYLDDEAWRYVAGTEHRLPGGHPPMNLAAGGWTASSRDLVQFLTALDGTSTGTPFLGTAMMAEMTRPSPTVPPRPNGTYFGLGWDVVEPRANGFRYAKDGGVAGISTWIEHLPLTDGVGTIDWALFFNARVENDAGAVALGAAVDRVRRSIESIPWRDIASPAP